MQIVPSIFKAYDIRGTVDNSELNEDIIFKIGQAFGSEALSQGEQTVITGRDGRLSSPAFSKALNNGILASGCNVIDIGLIPTPVLYFATCTLTARSGAMLTASHNPANYNGVKMVLKGLPVANEKIQKLYQRIVNNNLSSGQGKFSQQTVLENYIKYILNSVSLEKTKKLKIVIDCGNGMGALTAPILFKKLGCEVIELFCTIDGNFPNHHPDPSIPANLQDLIQAVKANKADVGLAFDGDADRLGVVTNQGNIIWPDRQLIFFALDLLSRKEGAEIIYDVKCTRQVPLIIQKHGGKPVIWKTGHSFIKEKLYGSEALLAGEMSGHMFFKERWFGFDDGVYAGVRLVEILSKQSKTIDQIFAEIPNCINTPELKLAMPEAEKIAFVEQFKKIAIFPEGKICDIDGIRIDFPDGFGLIRPSNTTSHLILRFEADTEASLKRIQDLFREKLLALNKELKLPF